MARKANKPISQPAKKVETVVHKPKAKAPVKVHANGVDQDEDNYQSVPTAFVQDSMVFDGLIFFRDSDGVFHKVSQLIAADAQQGTLRYDNEDYTASFVDGVGLYLHNPEQS